MMPVEQADILIDAVRVLREDATIRSLVGVLGADAIPGEDAADARVWNHVPQDVNYNYIRVRWDNVDEWDTKTSEGYRGEILVDFWTEQDGDVLPLRVATAVRAALHNQPLSLAGGGNVILLRYLAQALPVETDGESHRAVLTFDLIASE